MDNEAFTSLVRGRAGVDKSSQEIAREAVEEEFASRRGGGRKKRRRGGGDLSSDEDDDQPSRRRKSEKFHPRGVSKSKDEDSDDDDEGISSMYRDRAKERREGRNEDYQDAQQLLDSVEEATGMGEDVDRVAVSKILGGDEASTHLVKGLDLSLARSVKKERRADASAGKKAKDDTIENFLARVKTTSQAKSWLGGDPQVESSLGQDMLGYLRSQYLSGASSSDATFSVTAAGLVVQRSTITFSLTAQPGNVLRAWEIPDEQTYATQDASQYAKASTLDPTLLDRIEQRLASSNQPTSKSTKVSGTDDGSAEKITEQKDSNDRNDDESEEDIFAAAGDDYEPEDDATPPSDQERPEAGASFFDQIGSSNAEDNQLPTLPPANEAATHAVDDSARETAAGATRLTGLSSSRGFGGGYGEDIDMDFDGRLEEEDDDKKKKRKKKRKKQQDDD